MKPSIGRIVHYHAEPGEPGSVTHPIAAAIITAVWSETCVNLKIFFDDGPVLVFPKTSVMMGAEPGQWSWPERV